MHINQQLTGHIFLVILVVYGDGINNDGYFVIFYVDNIIYRAHNKAIKWPEWINSEYNTDGFTIDDEGYIRTKDRLYIISGGLTTSGYTDDNIDYFINENVSHSYITSTEPGIDFSEDGIL